MVSIIIPVFNRADILRATLESVRQQLFSDWECICINDHSTDSAPELLTEFSKIDSRFKIMDRIGEKKGAPVCRNQGFAVSKGEFVLFLDSDDILSEYCLLHRVGELEKNGDLDFIVFPGVLFSEKPDDASHYWNVDSEEDDMVRFFGLDAIWQTSGPLYRRGFLNKIGGFDEALPFWQDYDLHLRAMFLGARYCKSLNRTPDLYIRNGRPDTISRSTPFTADIQILKQRIDYLSLWIGRLSGISKFSGPQASCLSVLYFLCAQLFMRHGKYVQFLRRWRQITQDACISEGVFLLTGAHVILLKIVAKLGRNSLLKINLPSSFPDYYLISKGRIGKVTFPRESC